MGLICYNRRVIKDYITNNRIIIKKFCHICNISYGQYRRILNGGDVYVSVIVKISLVLKISFYEMFKVDDCDMFADVELYK